MKVLVLNTGSSSVKFRIFQGVDGEHRELGQGLIERIGEADGHVRCRWAEEYLKGSEPKGVEFKTKIDDHNEAIQIMCNILKGEQCPVIDSLSEIKGIGHRVVHGAEDFSESTIITDEVINIIEKCCRLAPLHNPPALQGIRGCIEAFGNLPQVAVFDTAFHATIPPEAYRYPVPSEIYDTYRVRKYGFHGTSHLYVSQKAIELLDMPAEKTRIITCHLGNGCSISAVKGGKCVDTSMGLTPLGGVMMGTRPGDIDPYLPIFMQKEMGMDVDEVDRTLNKKSGLFGICGQNDMRDIEICAEKGDAICQLALDMFAYRVARFIGSYAMVLGGCDAIVFTAGIGENGPNTRRRVLKNAGFLGCYLDESKNEANELVISTDESSCKAFVIPTNEELVIARDTIRIVSSLIS